MKQHTLIEARQEGHTYLITIGTDMGQFSGAVCCREEDYSNESKYFGFELAEIKAEIAYARAQRNHWEAQLKALTQFWRDMSETRNYDYHAFWVKQIRDRTSKVDTERQYWVETIKKLKNVYYLKIKERDTFNSRLASKREERV